MKSTVRFLTIVVLLTGVALSSTLSADQTLRCESFHQVHEFCRVDTHGYVRLSREFSKSKCHQGRTWDYDRRGIWVDDGCKAEFVIETRHHTNDHDEHNGEKAVAATAAIALIAAAVAASSHDDHNDRYHNDNYHRAGHASYLPGWMIGTFKGYNMDYGTDVSLRIDEDGRAVAHVRNQRLQGYVNDDRMYVGDVEFDIERAGNGFNTVQRGNRSNRVHYERVD